MYHNKDKAIPRYKLPVVLKTSYTKIYLKASLKILCNAILIKIFALQTDTRFYKIPA